MLQPQPKHLSKQQSSVQFRVFFSHFSVSQPFKGEYHEAVSQFRLIIV